MRHRKNILKDAKLTPVINNHCRHKDCKVAQFLYFFTKPTVKLTLM